MRRISLLAGIVLLGAIGGFMVYDTQQAPSLPTIVVYKTATCGCCGAWVTHVKEAGFPVEVHDLTDLSPVKVQMGIRQSYASCHTAVVDGYVIEGHVPVKYIQQVIQDKPEIKGLAVPGMPIGSPGMEVPGTPADAYDVLQFDAAGKTSVYAHEAGGR